MTTVMNNYSEVLMVVGNTLQGQMTIGLYPSVQKAIDALSGFYKSTVWSEKNEKVRIYGVVTEDNGYKHSVGDPIFEATESDFWDGRKPCIMELSV